MRRVLSFGISLYLLLSLIACGNFGSSGFDPSKSTILNSDGNIACTPEDFVTGMNYFIQLSHDAKNHTDAPLFPDYVKDEPLSIDDGNISLVFNLSDNGNINGFDMVVNKGKSDEQVIYEFYVETILHLMTDDSSVCDEYVNWMYGGKDYKDSYTNGYITHDITIQNVTMTAHACGTVDSLEFEGHNN